MTVCELCGSKTDSKLVLVKIAGSTMNVCTKCKGLGKPVDMPKAHSHLFLHKKKEEVKLEVVPNFASIINSVMARKGLNIHQLARALNIKESTLNKYLNSKIRPDVETAQRIEKFFDIKLTKEYERDEPRYEDALLDKDEKSSSTTLGDLINKLK